MKTEKEKMGTMKMALQRRYGDLFIKKRSVL